MSGFIRIKRSTFRIGTILLYAIFLSLIAYVFIPQTLTPPKPGEKSLRCQAANLYVGLARAAGENCTTKCTDWAAADCDGFSACFNKNISCTNGIDQDGRPCLGCCFDCTVECVPVDDPPSISGSISCGQWGNNGWCIDSATLDLDVSDPQGYSLRITGNAGGTPISCDGDCSIDLPSGSGSANFVVTASESGMSDSGGASWDYDPDSPNLGLNVNGSAGKNGWYRSSVTITPTGSDSISGLAGTFVSVNGGAWQPSATLDDGEHAIDFTAADHAGNVVNSSTTISVDTTTPTLSVRVRGKSGNGGWYISDVSISATASDATSGIASLEVSVDGGGYHSYSSAISFSSGKHTVQFRATDRAGNSTESSGQSIEIDKSNPTVSLITAELSDGTIAYKAHDGESGMSSIYITIEDKAGIYPKITWSDSVSGKNVTGEYNWNRMLQGETSAPPGEYTVWIKAVDRAGHVDTQTGTIVISEGGSLLTPSEDISASPENTPEEEVSVENITEDATFVGGGTTVSAEIEKQSISLAASASTGSRNSFPWQLVAGAATVAAGATAAKLLTQPKKKKPEPATNEDLRAERRARQREEKQAERDAKARADKEKAYQKTARTEFQEDVKWQKTVTARKKAADEAKKNQLSQKTQKTEAKEDAKWKKTVEAPKIAELNAGMAAYYEARKQGEKETTVSAPPKEKSWWEKAIDYVDQHQVEIALGVGVVIGIAAIFLSGGTATPLVAAAWTVGAAMMAGGTIAAGTVALNSYYGREWNENLGRNTLLAAAPAALVSGGWFLLQGAMTAVGAYCGVNPNICARVEPILNAWDTGEQGWLQAKLAYQTWKGDSNAKDTALDLQMEYLDGGMPGNSTARQITDLGEDAVALIKLYGDDTIPLLLKYGDNAIDIIGAYGADGVEVLQKYGSNAVDIIGTYGNDGVKILSAHGEDTMALLAQNAPSSQKWTKYIPEDFHDELRSTFSNEPISITLSKDVTVYRYWSGDLRTETGRWVTLNPNLSPEEARKLLALPDSNLANNITQFTIPAGTTILLGEAAEQTSASWAGAYALGGGLQMYLPDPSVLIKNK